MLKHGVAYDHIGQYVAILNQIYLVQSEMVVYNEDFVDLLALLHCRVVVVCGCHNLVLTSGWHPLQDQFKSVICTRLAERELLDSA